MRSTCWFAVVLWAAAIPGRATTIDDFTSPDQSVCNPIQVPCAGPGSSFSAAATNTIGGNRAITVVSPGIGVAAADVAAGQLTVTVDPFGSAVLTVQWQVSSLDITTLGTGISFQYSGGLGGAVTFTIANAGGQVAAIGPDLLPNSGGSFTFPFANFAGDLTVLSSADELTFQFLSNTGSGGTIDDLSAQGRFFALAQDSITFDNFAAVPEPSTLALLGPALAGLLVYRHRFRRHSSHQR